MLGERHRNKMSVRLIVLVTFIKIATPLSYSLSLVLDPQRDSDSFQGTVAISFSASSNLEELYLECDETLTVHNISVENYPGQEFYFIGDRNGAGVLRLKFLKKLESNRLYNISIVYSGKYIKSGMHLESYMDLEGIERFIIVTSLEPHSVKKLFPNLGQQKSRFDLKLCIPNEYVVISHLDQVELMMDEPEKSEIVTLVSQYPILLSQISFVVGFLDSKGKIGSFPREYRIHSRPQIIPLLDFALSIGVRILESAEDYFRMYYKWLQTDVVAMPIKTDIIPRSPRLLIIKEELLSFDKKKNDCHQQKDLIISLAIETSRVWFNRQLTLKDRNDVWIINGLSLFFGYYFADKMMGNEKNFMERFVIEGQHNVMENDFPPHTLVLRKYFDFYEKIDSSYKAASIIRMIHHTIGETNFRLAINIFFRKGEVTADDFYESLKSVCGQQNILPKNISFKDIINDWIEGGGYPFVSAIKHRDFDEVYMYHQKYLNRVESSIELSVGYLWVPLSLDIPGSSTKNVHYVQKWLGPHDDNVLWPIDINKNAFIVNKENFGYYRVLYGDSNWRALGNYLKGYGKNSVHRLNRAQLVDDAFTFFKCGYLSFEITFEFLDYLRVEEDVLPWMAFENKLSKIETKISGACPMRVYNTYKALLMRTVYESVIITNGFDVNEDDSLMTRLSRQFVLKMACAVNYEDCIQKSSKMLDRVLEDTDFTVHADIKFIVYCNGIKFASLKDWNVLFGRYLDASSDDEKSFILGALACTQRPVVANRYLKKIIDENSELRYRDKVKVITDMIEAGSFGVGQVIEFIRLNFIRLKKRFDATDFIEIFSKLGPKIVTQEHISGIALLYEHIGDVSDLEREQVKIAGSLMEENSMWISQNKLKLCSWIES